MTVQAPALPDLREEVHDAARRARVAARTLASVPTEVKNRALHAAADEVLTQADQILTANAGDLESARAAGTPAAMLDRLALNPQRIDGIITRFEEGTVAVDLSRLERRIDGLERLATRMLAAILFAALLIGGILLRPVDDVFGIVLMAASVVPLLAALLPGGGGRGSGRGR